MSDKESKDVTDGNATKESRKKQVIPGYNKFDDFIKVNDLL